MTRDKAGVDIVTEHFARTRPGTVPRLPASLFSDHSDHQEIIWCHCNPPLLYHFNQFMQFWTTLILLKHISKYWFNIKWDKINYFSCSQWEKCCSNWLDKIDELKFFKFVCLNDKMIGFKWAGVQIMMHKIYKECKYFLWIFCPISAWSHWYQNIGKYSQEPFIHSTQEGIVLDQMEIL